MDDFKIVYLNMLKRNIQRDEILEISESSFNHYDTIGDVICENILTSPYKLINDIIQNLKNQKNEFKYDKDSLKNLSDKDWKYYELIDKLPNDFSLTIIKCTENELLNKFQYIKYVNGDLMEFGHPNKPYIEYIWIRNFFKSDEYDDGFKNLLKHELGHVWTFIFGTLDENFKDGQGPLNENKILDPLKFNNYQKDVYIHLYKNDLNHLNFDYNYVLCKNNDESSNFELPVHIDNIIEILIEDYLNFHINEIMEKYLNDLFYNLNNRSNFKDLTIFKIYQKNKVEFQFSKIESIKNPIRRLFLIFAFGTKEQIEYFKNACEEEFGKIN